MDDAPRLITSYGVFDTPLIKATIRVLETGFARYGVPSEILRDHGSVFVSPI